MTKKETAEYVLEHGNCGPSDYGIKCVDCFVQTSNPPINLFEAPMDIVGVCEICKYIATGNKSPLRARILAAKYLAELEEEI